MSDFAIYNLLHDSYNLGRDGWAGGYALSSARYNGVAIAALSPAPSSGSPASVWLCSKAPDGIDGATTKAEYTVSFLAKAKHAGDRIHAEFWGSIYTESFTLTEDWKMYSIQVGVVDASNLYMYFWGISGNQDVVWLTMPMMVHSLTPAAWAPAAGETLSGGGTSMSANLIAGYAPRTLNDTTKFTGYQLTPEIDLWATTAFSDASKRADVIDHHTGIGTMPSLAKLSSNQTVTATCGVTASTSTSFNASALRVWIQYADSAGNVNWMHLPEVSETVTNGKWTRIGGAGVIPSGMHITGCGLAKYNGAAAFITTDVTLSYGSGLPVAEETFTPFETAAHAQTEYATYASQKILSDSITTEVKARAKTDTTVSEVSTRLTQTADSLRVSIDRLSETDKKVNSWFDFDSDSSGNPQLKMGSSTSPVVGIYSNTGLAYKSQSGDTLMELDASRSATVADHMESQDVKIGKWKWVQTQGGTHLTLVWAG